MPMMDVLSNGLITIKNNALRNKSECILTPASKLLGRVLRVMQLNGYIGEFEFVDVGPDSEDSVDYPIYAEKVAQQVAVTPELFGVLVCGSAVGMSIAANKVNGVRAALAYSKNIAALSRQHNDANVLSLGARLVSLELALEIVKTWLETPFEGGRHIPRIKQIDQKNAPSQPKQSSQKKDFENSVKSGSHAVDTQKPDTQIYDVAISFGYMIYAEGKNSIEFKIDPGLKSPSIIHIPSSDKWNSGVPDWAKNRRKEILDRLKTKSAHLECEWKEY